METNVDVAAGHSAPENSATSVQRFIFRGTGSEYFRIWIVNLLLTLLTLGIYGAWAKVRRLRYFYGSTEVAGSSFEYHGEPLKILKGRLIAVGLIAPYSLLQQIAPLVSFAFLLLFIVALPFIIVKSRQFQTRMSSWRNIRFGFSGTYGQAARIYLGLTALIPLTLGVLIPYVTFAKQRFVVGETRFGTTGFKFGATVGPYFRAYLTAIIAFLASILVFSVLLGLALVLWAKFGAADRENFSLATILQHPTQLISVVVAGVLAYALLLAAFLVPLAVIKARTTNEAFGKATIGPHRLNCSLSARKLIGIYLSNLLLTVLTLGLYAPWATVRLLQYQFDNMSISAAGDLNEFIASEEAQISAAGEEIGDLADIDFGL